MARSDIIALGDKVKTLHVTSHYAKKGIPRGAIGTVVRISGSCIGVRLVGYHNNASQYGAYWFNPAELEILRSDSEKVKEEKMKALKGYKKVAVIVVGVGSYYYALYDDDINVGDKVLVSGAAANKVLVVESIKEVDDDFLAESSAIITAEVICKVDMSAYEKRVADRKRSEELVAMMDKKIKEMDEVNKYAIYAQQNPELAEMLNEFKQINGLK